MLESDRIYIRSLLVDDLKDKKGWADTGWEESKQAYEDVKNRLERFDKEFPQEVITFKGVKRQA